MTQSWQSHTHPLWLRFAWPALLIAVSATLTLGFACATPFAALAVMAALTLTRGEAAALTMAIWLANQLAGYLVLGYPQTVNSFAAGGALAVAAIASTLTARAIVLKLAASGGLVQAASALAGARALYEVLLFLVAIAWLGGTETFALSVVGRILFVNVLTLIGLYAAYQLAVVFTVRQRVPSSATWPRTSSRPGESSPG